MKKTQGLGQSRREKEIGEEVYRILLWSVHPFSGLKHIFLQFKKKRKSRDLFCLPLLFLKSQALSHRSTELSNIHWSGKKEVFYTSGSDLRNTSGVDLSRKRLSPQQLQCLPEIPLMPPAHLALTGIGDLRLEELHFIDIGEGDSELFSVNGFSSCSQD